MKGTKTIQLKLVMKCTRCEHTYRFVVEQDKKLIHDGTKCPKCKGFGVPTKE